ncbi:MAG: VanZ family protein [Pseudomonadota bacterium]|nr:VanZ family protein [Pseudomonadota bacterium]
MLSDRRLRLGFRLALGACLLVVSVLAVAPLDQPPLTSHDKVNHILAFAVLAWLADGAYPGRELAVVRWGFLLVYGLMIEVVQHFLPYREFSLLDFAADVFGILCYGALSLLIRRRQRSEPFAQRR